MKYTPQAEYRVVVGSTVVNLLEATGPARADIDTVVLNAEDGQIRYMYDGNEPSSSEGILLDGERTIRLTDLSKFQLIAVTGNVNVTAILGTSLTLA